MQYFPLAEPVCKCDSVQCNDLLELADDEVLEKHALCRAGQDENAKYQCGSCECSENVGPTCQCKEGGGGGGQDERKKCLAVGDSQECSGHGVCECGTCLCHSGWVGKHCTCDKADIDCGDHGEHWCNQGQTACRCKEGWTTDSFAGPGQCSCPPPQYRDNCRPTTGKDEAQVFKYEECSGADQGTCQCNKCKCKEGFSGQYCQVDTRVNAKERTCDSMAPCILSRIYGNNQSISEEYREVRAQRFQLEAEKSL